MPFDQGKSGHLNAKKNPRREVKKARRVDFNRIGGIATGTPGFIVRKALAADHDPGLVVVRCVAEGFADQSVQQMHRIPLAKR
jgi:hypothetical protein